MLLGAVVAAYGTFLGFGSGILFVALLGMFYPEWPARAITSVTLAVVCANAVSGTAAYARQRRVDPWAALPFAVGSIPGAMLGATLVRWVPRDAFDLSFGVLLIVGAAVTLVYTPTGRRAAWLGGVGRTLVDATGQVYTYTVAPLVSVFVSALIGVFASLFGVGGGVMFMPAMLYLFGYPTRIAASTSQLLVAITALTGAATHALSGDYRGQLALTGVMVVSAIIGAQVGARIARRPRERLTLRLLTATLVVAGGQLLYRGLMR